MLSSMRRLASPTREQVGHSVSVSLKDRDLVFVLRGPPYSWFNETLQKAQRYRTMRVVEGSGDRLHQVAGAFGIVNLPLEDNNKITAEVIDGFALQWTWKDVLPVEKTI